MYINLMRLEFGLGDSRRCSSIELVYYIIISQTKLSRRVYLLVQTSSIQRHFPLIYWKPEKAESGNDIEWRLLQYMQP